MERERKLVGKTQAVIRFLAVSIFMTFASEAKAEIQSVFYVFDNQNKVEYRIDTDHPDNGLVIFHRKGQKLGQVLRSNVRFTKIIYNQGSLRSWLKGRSYFVKGIELIRASSSLSGKYAGYYTSQPGSVIVQQEGAIGNIPFKVGSYNLVTATAVDGNEKYLVARIDGRAVDDNFFGTFVINSKDEIVKLSDKLANLDPWNLHHTYVQDGVLKVGDIPETLNLRTFSNGSFTSANVLTPANQTRQEPKSGAKPVSNSEVHSNSKHAQKEPSEEKPITLPFEGAHVSSTAAVEQGGEKYVIVSLTGAPEAQGIYVVRARDNKFAKVGHDPINLLQKTPSIKDGILSIPSLERRVDLNAFNGEVKFQASRVKDVVLNKDGDKVDSTKYLRESFKDYVAMARANPDDFFEMVDQETLDQMAEALRGKRSAVLLGPAGVGKTSAIRALAREIANGKVPGIPRTLRIFEVPMSHLASGASFTGIFEERLSSLKAAAQDGGIVYYVPETQSMSGVGTHANKSTDIVQELKEPMEKGDFIILGASTDHEFKNAFATDPAFIDRFDRVQVKVPEGEELIKMIAARMGKEFPTAKPSRAVIEEAIQLSGDFDVASRQPRAAVNLLKKAYAILEGKGIEEQSPDSAVLKQAAIKKYGVDPARFSREERRKRLAQLEKGLNERFVGNENGKRAIHSVFKRQLTGVGDPESVNSILFRGPPGVGKTKLSKAAAEEMGYDFSLIEMNKFVGRNAVEDFRREVYSEILKNPFRVIVADELEKAPIEVQNAALSMLQDGAFRVTEKIPNGTGEVIREVNAKHSVFLLSTNAGGNTPDLKGEQLKAALLRGNISEPILSRIETVEYLPRPSQDEFKTALTKYLHETLERESKKQKAEFVFTNESEYIEKLMKSYSSESDYRDVKKMIRKEVDDIISDAILHDSFREHGKIELHWNGDQQILMFKCFMKAFKYQRVDPMSQLKAWQR